jgi:hypothetical protein
MVILKTSSLFDEHLINIYMTLKISRVYVCTFESLWVSLYIFETLDNWDLE